MFCDRNGDGVIKPENAPEASEVTQENSYYAFGMNMEFGAWENTPSVTDNLKQYNGKELNTDFGLNWNDYGARFYDPATARWNVMDPMEEKYLAWNPYNYVMNNPIRSFDPNGKEIWIYYTNADGKEDKIKYEAKMEYKGDDKFVSAAVNYLNTVNSSEKGATVLNDLMKSTNKFDVKNTKSAAGENSLQFDPSDSKYKDGGGEIKAAALLNPNMDKTTQVDNIAHELFHGYQREKGNSVSALGVEAEVEAYIFGRVVSTETVGGGFQTFGNGTTAGDAYDSAMNSLILLGFDNGKFQEAANNFVKGSSVNGQGDGAYKNQTRRKDYKNLIDKFIPIK